MTDPMMSRAHVPPGLGKCSDEPVRVALPEEIKEELAGLAFLHGVTVSELVRNLLIKELRGALFMARSHTGMPGTMAGSRHEDGQ